MFGLGVLVNTGAVLAGGAVGLLCRKALPERVTGPVMTGIGLCTVLIGLDGALNGTNALVVILAMVFGTVIGSLIDLDRRIETFGNFLERKFSRNASGSLSRGFVAGSLLFGIGAMAVVGSIQDGLGDPTMLLTKSMLDLISSIMLAASLGAGVLLSAGFILVFQGMFALLAGVIQPLMTDGAVGALSCAGSLMILALGLNLMGITKIKVANFMPALILAPLFQWVFSLPVFQNII